MFLIVGIVVGAGIFKAPAAVAAMTGSAGWMFLAWGLGGLLSLVGALLLCRAGDGLPPCRRRLLLPAARLRARPGLPVRLGALRRDHHRLDRPAGLRVRRLHAAGPATRRLAPAAGGRRVCRRRRAGAGAAQPAWPESGSAAQSWLTLAEIGGLLLVAATALLLVAPAPPSHVPPAGAGFLAAFGLAMVFVLLTYGGWNEAAYISAELRDGSRNMVRALLLSVSLIVTVLYLLVCWAYWHTLGMEGAGRRARRRRRGAGARLRAGRGTRPWPCWSPSPPSPRSTPP
jgi:APA family basic amino acid/polyamine antiporter